MPNIPLDKCCGCTACYSICPKSAIKMLPDEEGFLQPTVDRSLCVECKKCEQACPIIHKPQVHQKYTDAVIVQSNSKEVLNDSTSGGAIDALYKYVLEECKGYAVGVSYDSSFLPIHIITDSYEEAKKFRNSKYAQSDMGDVFQAIKKLLSKDKQVLFVGTPCQVGGLKLFLEKEYDNLITIDLVCRGVPSPKLWHKYLNWQESRYKSAVRHVYCRKKTYGYHSGALEIEFENGKHYVGSNRVDYYMKSFHSDQCSRLSCYECQFKTKHRCSDFTVFDSWNPEAVAISELIDNDKGYSNVIAHSDKAKDILQRIKNVIITKADPEKMFLYAGGMESNSIQHKVGRATYYADVNKLGFKKAVRKYINVTAADYLIEFLKPGRYYIKKLFKQYKD